MSVKRIGLSLSLMLLPIFSVSALAGEGVIVRWDDITVTREDMQRYLTFHLPEADHKKALEGNFQQYVRNILMMRKLAQLAREDNLGPSPEQLAWQHEYQEVNWLVQAYQAKAVEDAQAEMEWEDYAREVYIAEPERFTRPDKVDAAHILVSTQERTDEEAQALAVSLRKRALAGEDFAELAKEYSNDTGSRGKGGSLGEFEASQMVPPFSEAAFALAEPGDISNIVKTQFGYHIIKLNKKVPGSKRGFDSIKRQLIDELKQTVAKRTIDTMLGTLRAQAFEVPLDYDEANKLRQEYGLKPLAPLANN